MRDEIKFLLIILMFTGLTVTHCEAHAADNTALWLARSCVGEAGWESVETGECAAILHVYKKRSKIARRSILETARKYSAAIKPGVHHRNRWVRFLDGDEEPKHWPKRLKWSAYVDKWRKVRAYATRFVRGGVSDPLPKALHYGSKIDHWRAVRAGWRRIRCTYRNYFYIVPGARL